MAIHALSFVPWPDAATRAVVTSCSGRGLPAGWPKRYRKRGLDRTARRMVEFLEQRGIEGASVLEIGGGIGEIQIELLKRGAARSVNLELSPAYDEEAKQLLREAALEDRAERRLHDIAVEPDGVESADIVVLHRVVCCYPDYERLLGAAAQRAGRLLVFSYPPRNAVSRLFINVGEPRVQAAPEGVSELRPSAGGDARPPWRARASAHVRASQSRLAGRRARALGQCSPAKSCHSIGVSFRP